MDVGCGPGLLPAIFAREGHTAYGIDAYFSLPSSFLSINLTQADAFKLPFPSKTFNLVTATNLLFLLDDPLRALHEWKRVLAPGGELCLLNPSESLKVSAVRLLADKRDLAGIARESLLNWAKTPKNMPVGRKAKPGNFYPRRACGWKNLSCGLALDSPISPAPGFIDTLSLWGIIPRAAP